MTILFAYALALVLFPSLGCALLALAQGKPRQAVFGRRSSIVLQKGRLLLLGYGLLGLSAAVFLMVESLEFAVLLWALGLAVGGGVVSMALAYAPQTLRPLGLLFKQTDGAQEA